MFIWVAFRFFHFVTAEKLLILLCGIECKAMLKYSNMTTKGIEILLFIKVLKNLSDLLISRLQS